MNNLQVGGETMLGNGRRVHMLGRELLLLLSLLCLCGPPVALSGR
jgi:hypothetical protein